MIFFGHLGIGNTLVAPVRRGLPRGWILLGTIFPDLLDKPLYYGLVLLTGKRGAELGLISGTRTFGHTGLFLIILTVIALASKSRRLAALCLGISTHLLLDGLGDHFVAMVGFPHETALFWPFGSRSFPVIPFYSVKEHLSSWGNPWLLVSEGVGAALLGWDTWIRSHKKEVKGFFAERRMGLRRAKARRSSYQRTP